MNGIKETLGKLGDVIAPAVEVVIGDIDKGVEQDVEQSEKTETIKKILAQNELLLKSLGESGKAAIPDKPTPAKPKEESRQLSTPPGPPLIKNNLPKFPVYLILPHEDTAHTFIAKFRNKDKDYYYLNYNKKVYDEESIIGEKSFTTNTSNFVFLENSGKRLVVGACDFTPNAMEELKNVDRMKMEDRSYEKSHGRMKKKFAPLMGMNVIVAIILICVGVFLVLWVLFQGLPGTIAAINNAATIDGAIKAAHPAVNATINKTFVGA